MRTTQRLMCLVLFVSAGAAGAQDKSKGPVYPPINPAIAKLDQVITGLDGPGFCLAYNPARDVLVAGCDRGTLLVWHKDVLLGFRSGSGTGNRLQGHQGPVVRIAWTAVPTLASVGVDRKVHFWDMNEGKIKASAEMGCLPRALVLSADGKKAAGAGEDGIVHVWDTDSGKSEAALKDSTDWIHSLAFSSDGSLLAAGCHNGKVILWDGAGKKVRDLPAPISPAPKDPPEPQAVTALLFAPDGKTLFAGLSDGNLQVISVGDGKILRAMPGHTSAITSLALHPAGAVLASGSKDRTVRLWNAQAGNLFKALEGHDAWVEGIAFMAEGTRLASVSADQTVRIWDLTEPAKK